MIKVWMISMMLMTSGYGNTKHPWWSTDKSVYTLIIFEMETSSEWMFYIFAYNQFDLMYNRRVEFT
jgi:hypothetical protein